MSLPRTGSWLCQSFQLTLKLSGTTSYSTSAHITLFTCHCLPSVQIRKARGSSDIASYCAHSTLLFTYGSLLMLVHAFSTWCLSAPTIFLILASSTTCRFNPSHRGGGSSALSRRYTPPASTQKAQEHTQTKVFSNLFTKKKKKKEQKQEQRTWKRSFRQSLPHGRPHSRGQTSFSGTCAARVTFHVRLLPRVEKTRKNCAS